MIPASGEPRSIAERVPMLGRVVASWRRRGRQLHGVDWRVERLLAEPHDLRTRIDSLRAANDVRRAAADETDRRLREVERLLAAGIEGQRTATAELERRLRDVQGLAARARMRRPPIGRPRSRRCARRRVTRILGRPSRS